MLILPVCLLLAGCAGVVIRTTPETSETRPVFLLDHGRHATLILTRADQSLVRYAHGDWRWYAEDRTGPLRAFSTLLVPTRSAIGRRKLLPAADEHSLRRQIPVHIEAIHRFAAPASRIDALDRRLDALFEVAVEARFFNARFDLEFVPGPRPYTLFGNSNHVVAGWLQELDIGVRGNPIFGHWRVETD